MKKIAFLFHSFGALLFLAVAVAVCFGGYTPHWATTTMALLNVSAGFLREAARD